MRKYLLLELVAIAMLMMSVGCSITDDYRCESNDLCSSTTKWQYYSCSDVTGHCEKVDPLALDPLTLTDTTIGQSNYRFELTANGGIAPYSWLLTRGDEAKLKWLTITPEGENKAILHNSTDSNSVPLYPTEIGSGIPLTITLKDSSKHGTAKREDNQGKTFSLTINIQDCNRTNCDNGDSITTLVGTSRCNDGRVKICNQNSLGCAAWGGEESCSTNSCQTAGTNGNISCCADQKHCGSLNDTRCNKDTNWMEQCSNDATGCLSWHQKTQCSGKGCKSDGSNCIDCVDTCTTSGDRQCASGNTSVNTCLKNAEECFVWTLYKQCSNGEICIGESCSCSGCWDGIQCQPGNDVNKCGTSGVNCLTCGGDDNNTHCVLTRCTNGQCNYRYVIQSGGQEVLDTTTNLAWKRGIESGTYTWNNAINQCFSPYRLPTVDEFETIIELGHGAPTINTCAFPNTPVQSYWSSSSCDTLNSWSVTFHGGAGGCQGKTAPYYVRCVRSGP